MIWPRVLWGGVLAALLGYTFRRSLRWEHGGEVNAPVSPRWGRETFVLVPPTVLFWILLAFLALSLFHFGVPEGFVRFAALASNVLITLTVYDLALLALLPLLRRRISARACAVLWLVPAFLFWQAHVLIGLMPRPR